VFTTQVSGTSTLLLQLSHCNTQSTVLKEKLRGSSPARLHTHATGATTGIDRGSASIVYAADILRDTCVHHARRVVLVHNHPSGECDPSKEDIDTTNKITQALKYVGIRVLDHIIVGRARQDYFSFARAGMV